MKKPMALVLSIGLVLLGTAPVMAAGQAAKAEPPAQQEQVVQVAAPSGTAIDDGELEDVQGECWWIVAGAIGGAIAGALESYATTGKVDMRAVAKSAFVGAVVAAANPAGALVSEAQVFGRGITAAAKVAKYVRDGAIAGAAAGAADRAMRRNARH